VSCKLFGTQSAKTTETH